MPTFLFSIFLLCCQVSYAATFDKAGWESWKSKTYDKHLKTPTSYLNAVSLKFASKNKRLYLVTGRNGEPVWQSRPSSKLLGLVKNHGDHGLLTRPGAKDQKVSLQQKRFHWTLPQGHIAEVVYGSSSGKVWSYIYDPKQIQKFSGFRFYPFDPEAVVEGVFKPSSAQSISYKTVQGDQREVFKVGQVEFQFRGRTHTLSAYNWQDPSEKLNYIALIFTDLKAGSETYGGGRELAVEFEKVPGPGEKITLDFNRTGNFYCAHSPFWHCPTGLQQKLKVASRAGEMNPLRKISRKQ